MKWVDTIFSAVWDISDWFYKAYQETKGWLIVGPTISTIFLAIRGVFWGLLAPIANFGAWVDDVWSRVQNILTSEGLLGLIKGWFPWLVDIGLWFSNLWAWFYTAVGNWWAATGLTVQGWIAAATQGLSELRVAWGNFFTVILPTLFDLKYAEEWWRGKAIDLNTLIESRLKVWFPLYDTEAGQQPTRISFFRSPLDWLLEQFTDWFLGKE